MMIMTTGRLQPDLSRFVRQVKMTCRIYPLIRLGPEKPSIAAASFSRPYQPTKPTRWHQELSSAAFVCVRNQYQFGDGNHLLSLLSQKHFHDFMSLLVIFNAYHALHIHTTLTSAHHLSFENQTDLLITLLQSKKSSTITSEGSRRAMRSFAEEKMNLLAMLRNKKHSIILPVRFRKLSVTRTSA